jgi:hypothetical protein
MLCEPCVNRCGLRLEFLTTENLEVTELDAEPFAKYLRKSALSAGDK